MLRLSFFFFALLTVWSFSFAAEPEVSSFVAAPKGLITAADNPLPDSVINYGYCQTPVTALRHGDNGSRVVAAIGIDAATQRALGNARVTEVSISSGLDLQAFLPVEVFITDDISNIGKTVKADLNSYDLFFTDISLPEPYELRGEKTVYIGYVFTSDRSLYPWPIAIDKSITDNKLAFMLGTINDQGKISWSARNNQYGSVGIRARIEGETIPKDQATMTIGEIPQTVVGKTVEIPVTITNKGANSIESVTVEFTEGDVKTVSEVSFNALTDFNLKQTATTPITLTRPGANATISARLTAVNGNPVESKALTSVPTLCLPEGVGYKRNMVVEAAAGTWCGYCPNLIDAFETLRNDVNDNSFIPIAVHSRDNLTPSGYSLNISDYPNAFVNRDKTIGTVYPDYYTLADLHREVKAQPAIACLDLKVERGYEEGIYNYTVGTTFAIDVAKANYRIAFVVTEDEVGPYEQTNNYSGKYDDIDAPAGWTSLPSKVSMYFNDIARGITSYQGVAGSVPTSVKAWTTYEYSGTLKLSNLSDFENCNLIAMLINTNNGRIENAVRLTGYGEITGVESVDLDSPSAPAFTLDGNRLTVAAPDATICDISGRIIATPRSGATLTLPSGIFIIRTASAASKILIP